MGCGSEGPEDGTSVVVGVRINGQLFDGNYFGRSWSRDGAGNTIEENSSVFCLIRMR